MSEFQKWREEDWYFQSFTDQVKRVSRLENILSLFYDFKKDHDSYIHPSNYTPKDFIEQLDILQKFSDLIPTHWGYFFHKGDSYLINGSVELRIGYGNADEKVLRLLTYPNTEYQQPQELCDDITNLLDVGPFRGLRILTEFTHPLDCLCLDCNTKHLKDIIHYQKNKKQIIKRNGISGPLRHECLKRDRYRCRDCGATKDETTLEIDHIIPVSQGGTDTLDNLQTLCKKCNRAKHNRHWRGGE